MQEFLDRVPGEGMANRKKITHEDGSVEMVFIENADNPVNTGTPINRKNMMAIQGFDDSNIIFNADASITQTNSKGEATTIRFIGNSSFTVTFEGEKTIVKTIKFNEDGSISKTISGVIS